MQYLTNVSFRVSAEEWRMLEAIHRERVRQAVEQDTGRYPNRSAIYREALTRGLAAMMAETPPPPTS